MCYKNGWEWPAIYDLFIKLLISNDAILNSRYINDKIIDLKPMMSYLTSLSVAAPPHFIERSDHNLKNDKQ